MYTLKGKTSENMLLHYWIIYCENNRNNEKHLWVYLSTVGSHEDWSEVLDFKDPCQIWVPLTSPPLGKVTAWIFEDILCSWGSLREIVTDNGGPFIKALKYLANKYGIYHIWLSGYNHRANGLVEQSHFDVQQSLYNAADGNKDGWSLVTYSVMWAERVMNKRRMGCSPYFMTTGAHPLLPLDFLKATYLMPPPDSILSTTNLIAQCVIAP
jgi:hypothetical protein